MSDADPKRRLVTRRCHGCDEYRTQMIVHFGRGHYQTRARLPDFTPDGRIKIHEPNLSARHQTNSESSALLNSPITSSSSPASAILLAASAQPLRAGLAGLRNTSAPSSIVISAPALLSRPSCASTGLGMTTPWELPICRMLTCTARIVITMLFRRAGRVKRADSGPTHQSHLARRHSSDELGRFKSSKHVQTGEPASYSFQPCAFQRIASSRSAAQVGLGTQDPRPTCRVADSRGGAQTRPP